jgi:hypothetical protein
MSTVTKAIIGVAVFVAIIGIIILINGKSQQSDPTFAKAPPPGPDAVTLQRGTAKSQHPGPLYSITAGGVAPNQSGETPGMPASPGVPR